MALTAAKMRDEIEDTLRVAAMVQDSRRVGHVSDSNPGPTLKAAHGPWLAEVPVMSAFSGPSQALFP